MAFTNWFFGMDTNSAPPFPCAGNGAHFYIGRIGYGTTHDAGQFNVTTAEAVGPTTTSTYWDIEGPGSAPPGVTMPQWGVNQANAFYTAWQSTIYSNGSTLFGDLESGNSGWSGATQAQAQAIVHGFLQTLAGKGITPGLYVSKDNWNTMVGAYTSPIPFVLYLAGTDCPGSCTIAENEFNSTYTNIVLGGFRTMIWQYAIPSCTGQTKDLDITPYAGYQTGHWNPTT
jgi:hypothetical protein